MAEVKALLVVCKVPQAFDGDVAERVTQVIEDGSEAAVTNLALAMVEC